MDSRRRSLRELVEKWLSCESARLIHINRLVWEGRRRRRGVCIEAERASGIFSLVMFRYEDGSWGTYPPENPRPFIAVTCATSLVITEVSE